MLAFLLVCPMLSFHLVCPMLTSTEEQAKKAAALAAAALAGQNRPEYDAVLGSYDVTVCCN